MVRHRSCIAAWCDSSIGVVKCQREVKVRCRKEEGMLQEQEPRRVPDRRCRDRSRAGMCLNDTCMRRHAVRVSRTCSLHFTPYLYLDCERKSCAPRRLLRALTAYPGQPVFCPGTLLTSLAIASHILDYANVRSGGPRGVCACVVWVLTPGRTCTRPASHHHSLPVHISLLQTSLAWSNSSVLQGVWDQTIYCSWSSKNILCL